MGCLKLTYQNQERALEVNPLFLEKGLGKKGYADKKYVSAYRYGFNGMEKDDEMKGGGNSYDFGARIYDPRLGRWMSIDPLFRKYSGISPYNFAVNSPILFIDFDGADILVSVKDYDQVVAAIRKVTNGEVTIKSVQYRGGYLLEVTPKKNIEVSEETAVVVKLASKDAGDVTIKITDGANRTTDLGEGNSTVEYNPNSKGEQIENTDGSFGRSPIVGLYHELIHSENINDDTTDDTRLDGSKGDEAIYGSKGEQQSMYLKTKTIKPLKIEEYNTRMKTNKFQLKVDGTERVVGTTEKIKTGS